MSFTSWFNKRPAAVKAAVVAGGVAVAPVGAAMATVAARDSYVDNARKGRKAGRDAAKATQDYFDKIYADNQAWQEEERQRMAKEDKDAYDALAGERAIGKMGEADLAAFRNDPTAFIKANTDFDAQVAETVKAGDMSAAAKGDFLGSGREVRQAREIVSLNGTKRQEALGNIMALLQIGGSATAKGMASKALTAGRLDNLGVQGQQAAGMNAQAMAEYYRNLGGINAGGYADANATTMDLIKTGAGLGISAATLATGMPTGGARRATPQDQPYNPGVDAYGN